MKLNNFIGIFFFFLILALLTGCISITGEKKTDNNATQEQQNADLNADVNNEETVTVPTTTPPALTKQEKITQCNSLTIVAKNSCLKELAISEKDIEICRMLDLMADECIKDLAEDMNHRSLCDQITSEIAKEDCYNLFSDELAEKACDKITSSTSKKDECFAALAEEEKNYIYCRNVSSSMYEGSYTRDECYSSILESVKSFELCKGFIDANLRQDCFFEVGEENLDLNSCMQLQNKEKKDECVGFVAEGLPDLVACDLLSSNELRKSCVSKIATSSNKTELCDEISDTNSKYSCFMSMAEKNLDSEICAKILNYKKRDDCYYSVALLTVDEKACSKITVTPQEWNDCFSAIAQETNKYVLCNNINFDEQYVSCFVNIAVSLNAPEVCLEMSKKNIFPYSKFPAKDLCYKNTAIELEMESLCEQINDGNLMEACFDGNADYH